ncbi:serglycin [Odontesthes bonariensis]|uniref:serglycin n=1 Tax=Odontesthes bonariensis TaxID=219752 RepID=UPI003F58A30D
MKLILLLLISCLALHNGKGAPRTAVYKFVRCNPEGDQANCVTQQSPEMPWSSDLPSKLPASTAQYLEVESVEDESPQREEGDEVYEQEEMEEEETPIKSEDGESPGMFLSEEGSGSYEGSAVDGPYYADWATPAESETGSGEHLEKIALRKDENVRSMRKLFPSIPLIGEAKPTQQDLEEDHLLKL